MNSYFWESVIVNFIFTIILYFAFPILFAVARNNPIGKRIYNVISYAVNIILSLLIKAAPAIGSGAAVNYSFAPCILWTTLGIAIGSRILRNKKILYQGDPNKQMDLSNRFICRACANTSPEPLDVCPKCGVKAPYMDKYSDIAVPLEKRFRCNNCNKEFSQRHDSCPNCGSLGKLIERPTIPFVRDTLEIKQEASASQTKSQPLITEVTDNVKLSDNTVPKKSETTNGLTKKTQTTSERKTATAQFCRECGTKLASDVAFCPNCGTKVIQYLKPEKEPPKTGAEPAQEPGSIIIDSPILVAEDFRKELPSRLRRAFMLAEDGEWEKADEYFERVLDEDPENAYAYLGKLLCEKQVHNISDLKAFPGIDQNKTFIRAVQFSDDSLKPVLQAIIE